MNTRLYLAILLFITMDYSASSQVIPPYTISYYTSASTGYYFCTPWNTGVPNQLLQVNHLILDGKGDPVYVKNLPTGAGSNDLKIQPNGLISYSQNSKYYLMDSTFTVIDSVSCKNGVATDTHDMQVLSNGHFLLLGLENVIMDLSAYNVFGPANFPGDSAAIVKSAIIQEQDANKNVVFEWHAIDHFSFLDVDDAWLVNSANVDWTHSNALEQDYDGNFLLSSRHFNEITKINRTDSSIMWRLGGNANMFTFLNDPMQFKRQHDIRRNANGNITLFDNGDGANSTPFHYTAAKEYILDEQLLTAYLNTSIVDDSLGYSTAMGNFDYNPNGLSVISYGLSTIYDKDFNTYDSNGQKVFQLEYDDPMVSYRTFHYDSLPWSLPRPELTCFNNNGIFYLDADPGYASYLWSTGETTQSIAVTSTGSYHVFVPFGQGGCLASPTAVINDLNNPCAFTSLNELTASGIEIYPNPANDYIIIKNGYTLSGTNGPLQIHDLSGREVLRLTATRDSVFKLDISNLKTGLYIITSGNERTKFLKY